MASPPLPKPLGAYSFTRRSGNLLFLSGMGPRDPLTDAVPGGDVESADGRRRAYDVALQTHQCITNVEATLAAAGLTIDDIIDVQAFLIDMKRDFKAFNAAYGQRFGSLASPPTRTTIEVSELPPGGRIAVELKVVAAFPVSSRTNTAAVRRAPTSTSAPAAAPAAPAAEAPGRPAGTWADGPLNGIVVVDLTRILAGPMCTRILGDLGARIIKVEQPPLGDGARGIRPFVPDAASTSSRRSAYFAAVNSGKQSVGLDLKKSAQDRATFERLLDQADVLVENYAPGVMKRLGYDWPQVHRRWPSLVMASLSGFGQTGPKASSRALDTVIQAASGIMSVTGFPDRPPVRVGASISDVLTGVWGACGVQAALLARERQESGGQHVDIAMLDCSVAACLIQLASFHAQEGGRGENPARRGAMHPFVCPFDVFPCAEGGGGGGQGLQQGKKKGFVCVTAAGNDKWKLLCAELGLGDRVSGDARFKRNQDRLRNYQALKPILDAAFERKDAGAWEQQLQQVGIPCAKVNDISDVVVDPQLQHRNMLLTTADGKYLAAGNPIKLSGYKDLTSRADPPVFDAGRARL